MSSPLDAQSRAYRENDHPVTDQELMSLPAELYVPISNLGGILLPGDYEAMHWDAGRSAPKTLDQARASLAARIADPAAPDGREVQDAYDDLDDTSG